VTLSSGTGLKLGTSGGFQLVGQGIESKAVDGGTSVSSGLLAGQQSLSTTIKPICESETKPSEGFKLPSVSVSVVTPPVFNVYYFPQNTNPLVSAGSNNETSSGKLQLGTSGGLQLGSRGGVKLGAGGGLQLGTNNGTGGLQLGSSSGLKLGAGGGLQLGTGGGLQLGIKPPVSSNTEESSAVTDNVGGIKLSLVGQKRSLDESDSTNKPDTSLLSKQATSLPKTVTFKLDGDNKNNNIFSGNKQTSSGQLGSTVGVAQPILGGITNQPQLSTSESSSVKPFANLFQQTSSAASSGLATFSFSGAKPTTSLSTVSATSATTTANLLNFTQGGQQSIFASPSQAQQSAFGASLGKIPSKSESSGNTPFAFLSGTPKSNESSQGNDHIEHMISDKVDTVKPLLFFPLNLQCILREVSL